MDTASDTLAAVLQHPRKILHVGLQAGVGLRCLQQVANGHVISCVHDIEGTRRRCESGEYDVGIIEFADTSSDTLAALADLVQSSGQHMRWIAMVSHEQLADAALRQLIGSSFFDFHSLPADPDRLRITLGHAFGMAAVGNRFPNRTGDGELPPADVVGESDPIQRLRRTLARVAAVDAPVLLQGESGTGKELAAVSLHRSSSRGQGPFVAVNCAAIPDSLIHSELFGYEKGAFTGADRRTQGKIEAASGGVLFLDEIGDLAPDLQVTLLRFLQEGVIQRVGGTTDIPVDVRVICATHVDLRRAVSEGRFREDLFYRINVLEVTIPPLRERDADVELLAHHFFTHFAGEKQPYVKGFSDRALMAMREHHWPGNVRELMNRVRKALVMSENLYISPEDLGLVAATAERVPFACPMSLAQARAAAERSAIQSALAATHHNMSVAARVLGVSRATLYRLMHKHDECC